METNIIQELSEKQSKIFSEIWSFEKFAYEHETELVELFKQQFPDVKLMTGKIHVHDGHISINSMQYWFSNGKWKKL